MISEVLLKLRLVSGDFDFGLLKCPASFESVALSAVLSCSKEEYHNSGAQDASTDEYDARLATKYTRLRDPYVPCCIIATLARVAELRRGVGRYSGSPLPGGHLWVD